MIINLFKAYQFKIISSWKELVLLHIICYLLCYASTIQRIYNQFCSSNQVGNFKKKFGRKQFFWCFSIFSGYFLLLARIHRHGWIFCKKSSSKRSLLLEIGAQTFWAESCRVATSYSLSDSWQIQRSKVGWFGQLINFDLRGYLRYFFSNAPWYQGQNIMLSCWNII